MKKVAKRDPLKSSNEKYPSKRRSGEGGASRDESCYPSLWDNATLSDINNFIQVSRRPGLHHDDAILANIPSHSLLYLGAEARKKMSK